MICCRFVPISCQKGVLFLRHPVFISAYRKSYSTQHVLINLVEDWREKLDKDFRGRCYLHGSLKGF